MVLCLFSGVMWITQGVLGPFNLLGSNLSKDLFVFFFFLLFLEREEGVEREREREILICCPFYLCIHWLTLVCALSGYRICNLGISRQWFNQLSYPARETFFVLMGKL